MVAVFQSTPPRGGRPLSSHNQGETHGFNPRPRVGGDQGELQAHHGMTRFNPRPRVGGDPIHINMNINNSLTGLFREHPSYSNC